jgi:DNA-binding CsgD family transcriptional regulator
LIGHAVLLVEGFAQGMEILRPAVGVYRTNPPSGDDETRALWFACDVAGTLWDDEARLALSARYVDVVREAGAFNLLPLALEVRAIARILTGGLAEAGAALEEATAVTEALGNPMLSDSGWLLLSAWRDAEDQAAKRIDASIRTSVEKGEDGTASYAEFARATLCNGLGQYRQAFEVAERCCANHPLGGFGHVLSELVEAAVRCGELDQAENAFKRLCERTQLSGSDWALGVEARARALLAEQTDPEPLYRESIERLGRTHARPDLARAHLLYGEWLRRGNRRSSARTELRHAYELFSSMGANAFTERARRELLATGEKVRRRVDETRGDLTPQEAQIARLAADGYTNPEIGAQLFLSPRTVEYHLRKVYPKLGVKSRRELRTAVGSI